MISVEDLDFKTLIPRETLEGVIVREKNLQAVAEWVDGCVVDGHVVVRGCTPPFYKPQKAYPGDMVCFDPQRSEIYVLSFAQAKEVYEFD